MAIREENVSASDPAPIYDNVKRMADFLAKEIGEELAVCARYSPDIWCDAYVNRCFRSYENLAEVVDFHISWCYLKPVLLAIKNKDDEFQDDKASVSAYILRHSKARFNACLHG